MHFSISIYKVKNINIFAIDKKGLFFWLQCGAMIDIRVFTQLDSIGAHL